MSFFQVLLIDKLCTEISKIFAECRASCSEEEISARSAFQLLQVLLACSAHKLPMKSKLKREPATHQVRKYYTVDICVIIKSTFNMIVYGRFCQTNTTITTI